MNLLHYIKKPTNISFIRYLFSRNHTFIKTDFNEINNNGLENDDWLGDR